MRFKLDENFTPRMLRLFHTAGHEAYSVREQGLQGCADQRLYEMCCHEKRCMVTMDLDFSDITRFPPERANGIAVIRVPRNPSLQLLERLVRELLDALTQMPLQNRLWIVEPGRIRVHQSETTD